MRNAAIRDLESCQQGDAAKDASVVLRIYQQLADCPTVEANSIVRRAYGIHGNLLELPLSTLCKLPELQQFFCDLALDGTRFHQAYNRTLEAWRESRKTRNPANPFPNLARLGDRYEFPLWYVDLRTDTRSAVWVQPAAERSELWVNEKHVADVSRANRSFKLASTSALLVPRGALITIVFRLLCSDLFVHGLGGQVYDQYTDTLIQDYFGIDAPAFVVASASRYLFPDLKSQLNRLDQLATNQRTMTHHPEEYLGQDWFSSRLEQQLVPLLEQKRQWIAALRALKQAGTSAASEGRRLHELQRQIKEQVADDVAARLQQRSQVSDAARAAIESRTYPWFFFAWPQGE